MRKENLETKSSQFDLSELSFAELSKLRKEIKAPEETHKGKISKTKHIEEQKQKTTSSRIFDIELSENIDFNADYFKLPNNVNNIAKLQDEKEHCVYMYLFKLSYGLRRNFCRVGYDAILKNTSLSSRSSVIRAIEGLIQKNHIIKIKEDMPKKSGTLYRVLSPDEIISNMSNGNTVNLNVTKLNVSRKTMSEMSIIKNEN